MPFVETSRERLVIDILATINGANIRRPLRRPGLSNIAMPPTFIWKPAFQSSKTDLLINQSVDASLVSVSQ